MKCKYANEDIREFDRLEKQGKKGPYLIEDDLGDLVISKNSKILDAGCGSGILGTYLARKYPHSTVLGCDFSKDRIEQDREAYNDISNISFDIQDLKNLTYDDNSFDVIVSRYVVEHHNTEGVKEILSELYRILRPGGIIRIIDVDGFLFNLYPKTEHIEECLKKLKLKNEIDPNIGRKLPYLMSKIKFEDVRWEIKTWNFVDESMNEEIETMKERFDLARDFFSEMFDGRENAVKFENDYLTIMRRRNTVLFYNKFILTAFKYKTIRIVE